MKHRYRIIVMMLLGSQFLWAITVSISGTVKNGAVDGIAGVTVSLSNLSGFSVTTDDNGIFSIGPETGLIQRQPIRLSGFSLSLAGNKLIITPGFENMTGCMDVFSSNGRKIASVVFGNDRTEKQVLDLPELTRGLNIIRITINGKSVIASLVCIGESVRYLSREAVPARTADFIALGKQAAVTAVDTLTATKEGYAVKKIPIGSYEQTDITITMEEAFTGAMPLVYDKEYTGSDCTKPTLPADPTSLPPVAALPDPFLMADGTTRMTTREQWRCRRAEILETIMKYETGQKPPKPENFSATLSDNKISITCGVGGNTINLSATINRPNGAPDGPIPAIINRGSLTDVFSKRGIATINFGFESQLTGAAMGGAYNAGNFYKLYPQTDAGYMLRWAWGVSRVIDALEMLPEANIDTKHLAVSGCSYMGKFALYSGTFDERIALTIPHESGGGGTISWRYSDMLEDRDNTEVENLHHAQGASWYSQALKKYVPTNVFPNTLPFDQHELMALCLPRALFCIESSMIARMGAEAARLDALAVRRMYTAFGIEDRFGVTEANVNHCTWASSYTADLEAFVDKFLLGKEVNTNILRSKFTSVDTAKWIPWEAPALK